MNTKPLKKVVQNFYTGKLVVIDEAPIKRQVKKEKND